MVIDLERRRDLTFLEFDRHYKDLPLGEFTHDLKRLFQFFLNKPPFVDRLPRKAGDEKVAILDGLSNFGFPYLTCE